MFLALAVGVVLGSGFVADTFGSTSDAQDERDRVVVRAAPPGLPAAGAGLSAGDANLSVDGLDVTEIGIGGVVTLLRGDPGTPLVLRYMKPDGVVKEVRVVRV